MLDFVERHALVADAVLEEMKVLVAQRVVVGAQQAHVQQQRVIQIEPARSSSSSLRVARTDATHQKATRSACDMSSMRTACSTRVSCAKTAKSAWRRATCSAAAPNRAHSVCVRMNNTDDDDHYK